MRGKKQTPALIPIRIHEAIQQWIEQAPGRPSPGGDSKFWLKMGERFHLLRDTSKDNGDRLLQLGLSRQWGRKLWYATGDQDSINKLSNLWAESEVTSGFPKPDPETRIEYTWLNDVLSYAVQPIHRAVVDRKSLQGGRHFDEEHTILLVSDYCIAAIDVCRDNANAALTRERTGSLPTQRIAEGASALTAGGRARRKRLKPKPGVLPKLGTVNKAQAAKALGVTPRTIERTPDLPHTKARNGNRYKVTDLRRILDERGVRQTPTE